jgi:hypothetical protein
MHEGRATLVQPDAHPTLRRVALLDFANPVRWGTTPSAAQQNHSENACTCIGVERVVKAIVVIQSVIGVTELVTVLATGALTARESSSLCCATSLSSGETNGKVDGECVVVFRDLFPGVASRRRSSDRVPLCYR